MNKTLIVILLTVFLWSTGVATIYANPLGQLNDAVANTELDQNTDIYPFIGAIVQVVLGLLGIVLVLLIIYGGFLWMTAQGETAKVEKAKSLLKNAIIGLIIVLSAYAISYFVIKNILTATA